jgi:hypothetical protein
MKKLITLIALCAAIIIPATAQTNVPIIEGPGVQAFEFLTSPNASNWMALTYAIKTKNAGWGAGFGAYYKANDFIGATLRVDFFDNSFWMPQCNVQLQAPVKIMGAVTAIPFLTTGIATQIQGSENQQGTVVAVFGAGLAIRLPVNSKWYVPDNVFGAYEKWSDGHGSGIRAGLGWRF